MDLDAGAARTRYGQSSAAGLSPPYDPAALATAGAAHDLANYLQVIASAVGIVERALSGEARSMLEPVLQGARTSIDHACDLSRKVAAMPVVRRDAQRPVRITDRIEALQPVILLAIGPGVQLDCRLHDAAQVLCDPDALDNAIMNLVTNAARAMPDGGRLTIAADREDDAPRGFPAAVLSVADTGCGMPPDVAARAFHPGVTAKPHARGAGLGLATVAAFARACGGKAMLDSRLGLGTVVTITLPAHLKTAKSSRLG